jgi:hypothetical protein
MGTNIFKVDREARGRIRMILAAGLLAIVPTAAFASFDELTVAYACLVFIIFAAYLLSRAVEAWFTGRSRKAQATAPGCAIDVSSMASRVQRVRLNYLGAHLSPQQPFHQSLMASAGAAIKKRKFFCDREPALEEGPESCADSAK